MHADFHSRLRDAIAGFPAPYGLRPTDTWIGDQLGVTRQAVAQWKAEGGNTPSLTHIEKLARLLFVEPCWLAFGIGEMRPKPRSIAHAAPIEAHPPLKRRHK